MDLERGNVIAGYAGLTEPSDFNKKYLDLRSEDERRSYGCGTA